MSSHDFLFISAGAFMSPRGRSLLPVKDLSSSGHLAVQISSVLLNAAVLIPVLISFICCGPEKISHHVCTRTVSEPRPAFCISLMSGDSARGRVFHRRRVYHSELGAVCRRRLEMQRRVGSRVQGQPPPLHVAESHIERPGHPLSF